MTKIPTNLKALIAATDFVAYIGLLSNEELAKLKVELWERKNMSAPIFQVDNRAIDKLKEIVELYQQRDNK